MERVIRFRIDENLLRRFRSLCVYMDISAPKQTEAIIKEFVEVHEENIMITKQAENEL